MLAYKPPMQDLLRQITPRGNGRPLIDRVASQSPTDRRWHLLLGVFVPVDAIGF